MKKSFGLLFLLAFSAFLTIASHSATAHDSTAAILLKVDQSGYGDFWRIQDAIDAVPSHNKQTVFISVMPGIYRERVVVPSDKPFIILSGENEETTIITWSGNWLTLDDTTVSIQASDFVGRRLTIQNTHGPGAQAVALSVFGDRVAFYQCKFRSYQDTLYDDSGRHYYKACYIEGATDFIYGNGRSLFEKCHLHSISKNGGAITAQKRVSPEEKTGYIFVLCKITGVAENTVLLGRPWGDYSKVIYILTFMGNAVMPQGWNDWDDPPRQKTSFYSEFECYGPGSHLSGRVKWMTHISPAEAVQYIRLSIIDGEQWIKPMPTHFKRFHF